MEKSRSKLIIILIVAIAGLFLATRLYRLDVVPFGPHIMHIDELGAAYDSFCISEYGVDQFRYHMPVYFMCFGEGQNALYTYLAVFTFKLLGISIFSFRLPAVICAAGAFIALFFLLRDMLDEWYAAVGLALMTVMPVFMMSEHWGLECYLMISFVIISMAFQIRAVITNSSVHYFFTGLFWGITLYTYAMSYIMVPSFLLLSFIVLLAYRKLSLKNAIIAGIPLMILGVPLFVQQLVMMGIIEPFSFMGWVDFWRSSHYRGDEISVANVLENLTKSFKYIYVADRSGYDANPRWGTMYYVSVPFIIIGMISSGYRVIKDIKARVLNPWLFNWLYFLSSRLFLLFVKYPNINRVNGIYPAYLLFTVYGIKTVADKIKKKAVYFAIVAAAYAICFVTFSKYFYSYDGLINDAFGEGDSLACDLEAGEAAALAKQIANGKPVVALVNEGWQTALSIALYTQTSPYEFFRDNDPHDRYFNGVEWYMPDGLDLSGDTVYLIDNNLRHITSYLTTEEGFSVDITYPDYTIVAK
ncbi:MAG: glycosyltransferase family 39 protein [Lachnospiraceae bacterium]|nr:glycosyltransferase family 39 protein [Lachnospiraceae bacterium]